MGNFGFNMLCEGDELLAAAMKVVFRAKLKEGEIRSVGKLRGATHYVIRPKADNKPLRLIFFSYVSTQTDHVQLPFTLDSTGAADFARRWLAEAEYGPEPGHDGSNNKGWRLYNERYGHIDDDWGAIIAVAPAWAEYGK